ncbi:MULTISPECIES: universal stress protein [unclassified Microbacterium]|uniref:universal stress protein n=1 Tax=unclassified Microbacterium TaxID=2609290 RepID=UPI00301958D3
MDMDRIIVGVDGSPSSIAALKYAARLAQALHAPLEAVTTWTYPPMTGAELVIEWQPEQDAQQILDQSVVAAFGDAPPDALTRTVLSGPPARTLIDLSETAGMLVLGSRGRGGFAGLLLGSVSASCASHAHCPVLIMHTDDDETDRG